MAREIPDGVICLWRMKKKEEITGKRGFRRLDDWWELVEAYPVDDDGRPTGETINVDGSDRHPHDGWMRTPILDEEGEEIGDNKDAMGRAVTYWSMSGVELLDFHPRTWKSVEMFRFHDLLKVLKKEWVTVFEFGYGMELATIAAAHKILFEDKTDA